MARFGFHGRVHRYLAARVAVHHNLSTVGTHRDIGSEIGSDPFLLILLHYDSGAIGYGRAQFCQFLRIMEVI